MRDYYVLKPSLFLLLLFITFSGSFAQVTGDFRSLATGNWSASTTWQRYSSGGVWEISGIGENNPGQVPGVGSASGNVTIQNLTTVTFDMTNAVAIASLSVGSGASGVFQFETVTNRTLTITGNLSILGGAAFNVQNSGSQAGSVVIGGNLSNAGTMNIRQSATRYADIVINGTALSGNGTYTALRNVTIGGAVTNSSTSQINLYGDLTCNNTLTCSAGTISFVGATAQNLNGTANSTFSNLDIRNTGTAVTVGGTVSIITVSGALTMNAAGTPSFSLGTTLSTFSVGTTFTMANVGTTFDFGTTVAKTVTV